jgi:hypothetical protein
MIRSSLTTLDIVTAFAGGLLMIKGVKILRSLNSYRPWYKDHCSVILGTIGIVSLFDGVHGIAGRVGLPKSNICRM